MRWPTELTTIIGVNYYDITTVCKFTEKSKQTVRLWIKWSDDEERAGRARLIPKPVMFQRKYCWSKTDILEIMKFSRTVQYGQLSKLSRSRWGVRGQHIIIDKSLEAREHKAKTRKTVDKKAKENQAVEKRAKYRRDKKGMDERLKQHANKVISINIKE